MNPYVDQAPFRYKLFNQDKIWIAISYLRDEELDDMTAGSVIFLR